MTRIGKSVHLRAAKPTVIVITRRAMYINRKLSGRRGVVGKGAQITEMERF